MGPALFQPSDYGEVELVGEWTALDHDGVAITDSSCQILTSITGPGDFRYAVRSAECSDSWAEYRTSVTEPGDYTFTVTDELTGSTSETVVQVIQ